MTKRIIPQSLLLIASLSLLWVHWFTAYYGDFSFFLPQIYLTHIHLSRSWEYPYFTPALCGGLVLGADPQSMIFSIYQVVTWIFSNPYSAIQISNILVALIFASGFYFWLDFLGVKDRNLRIFACALLVLSGFWTSHFKYTHLSLHGICYVPWIMVCVERSLSSKSRFLGSLLYLTALLFLLINSGYVGLQILIPLFLGRVSSAIYYSGRTFFRDHGRLIILLCSSSAFALILSAGRLSAIFQITMAAFPREMDIYGTVRDNFRFVTTVFSSLFDFSILSAQPNHPDWGGWWEWTSYMGLLSLPLGLYGLFELRKTQRNAPILGFVLGVGLAALMIRTGFVARALRAVFPILGSISWYQRGMILIVMFWCFLISLGLQRLLRQGMRVWFLPVILVLIISDLFFAYYRTNLFFNFPSATARMTYPIPERMTGFVEKWETNYENLQEVFGKGLFFPASFCYNPVVGYTGQKFHSQVKDGTLNLNDVGTLFSSPPDYYGDKPWPLWPPDRSTELQQFLEFKQIIAIPGKVQMAMRLSQIGFCVFILLSIFALVRLRYSGSQEG